MAQNCDHIGTRVFPRNNFSYEKLLFPSDASTTETSVQQLSKCTLCKSITFDCRLSTNSNDLSCSAFLFQICTPSRHWSNFFLLITKKFAIDETMNKEVEEAQKRDEDENRRKLNGILVSTVESKYFPISLGPKRALDIYLNDDHRMIRKEKTSMV